MYDGFSPGISGSQVLQTRSRQDTAKIKFWLGRTGAKVSDLDLADFRLLDPAWMIFEEVEYDCFFHWVNWAGRWAWHCTLLA
jgi:hypothetical protein